MGAWGIGLYSGDFARDLKATISAVCRLPLDEEALVDAICQSESSAARDPADADHTTFWLVLADQFEKRLIFSRRVRADGAGHHRWRERRRDDASARHDGPTLIEPRRVAPAQISLWYSDGA